MLRQTIQQQHRQPIMTDKIGRIVAVKPINSDFALKQLQLDLPNNANVNRLSLSTTHSGYANVDSITVIGTQIWAYH